MSLLRLGSRVLALVLLFRLSVGRAGFAERNRDRLASASYFAASAAFQFSMFPFMHNATDSIASCASLFRHGVLHEMRNMRHRLLTGGAWSRYAACLIACWLMPRRAKSFSKVSAFFSSSSVSCMSLATSSAPTAFAQAMIV